MTSAAARLIVALALCTAIGAHWAALQSLAWGRMIVQYSQHASLAKAVAETLDGNHPCDLCKRISSARHSEKKPDAQPAAAKLDLIASTGAVALMPPSADFSFPVIAMRSRALAHSPPTPPPRSQLA